MSRISSEELTEQYEFYKRHPYGDDWRQTARICYTLALGSLKGKLDENEWMPFPIPVELKQQSEEEVRAIFGAVTASVQKAKQPKKKCTKAKKPNGNDRKS